MFTILSGFLFFLFSALGLSLLYATHLYKQTCGYRQNLYLLEKAAENGAKKAFHSFTECRPENPRLYEMTAGEAEVLFSEMCEGSLSWLNNRYGMNASAVETGGYDRMVWESRIEGRTEEIASDESCSAIKTLLNFSGKGKIHFFPTFKTASLETSLQSLLGFIPLAAIPALLEHIHKEDQTQIRIAPGKNSLFPFPLPERKKGLLPQSACPMIGRALKIRLFNPGDLTNATLRAALGLEVSDDPVPEAVYLIKDDLGLGGIFVQGDLDRLSLGLEGPSQIMSFTQGERDWNLSITPEELKTVFQTPEGDFTFSGIPRGIVFVEGNILSLQERPSSTPPGWPVPLTPCLLNGIQMTIVSPKKIVISSNLLQQGLTWKDGIPYLKYSRSQLNLFASFEGEGGCRPDEGLITIDSSAPDELFIQADMTAVGQGFLMNGTNRKLTILGGLHVSTLNSPQNKIDIIPDERMDISSIYWRESVRTKVPVLFTSSFQVIGWQSNPAEKEEEK